MAKEIKKLTCLQTERPVPVTFPYRQAFVYTVGDGERFAGRDLYIDHVSVRVDASDTATSTWTAALRAAEAKEGIA